jgi:hypothetical protein
VLVERAALGALAAKPTINGGGVRGGLGDPPSGGRRLAGLGSMGQRRGHGTRLLRLWAKPASGSPHCLPLPA